MSLVNFYSNIWIYYNTDLSKEEFLTSISKIKTLHSIKSIINIDNDYKFWDINENTFNELIATQVIVDKQSKCVTQFNNHCKLLESCIINNKLILIITYNKLQVLVTFLVYFLNKKANISLDKAFTTLNSKLSIGSNFKLNVNLKKILLSNCIN